MNTYNPTVKEINFLANYYKILRNQVYLALKYLEKKHVKNDHAPYLKLGVFSF